MKFYAPLTKVEEQDDGTLHIEGIASAEAVDSAGEIVLASAMKAAIPGFMVYGTGALREMHGLSAAGTVDEAQTADDGNTYVKATVVDESACRKLLRNVYKGLSIGGKVLSRDPDNRKVITGIAWTELSLVDRPCCPSATIDLVRADWTHGLTQEQIERAEPDDEVEMDIENTKNATAEVETAAEGDQSAEAVFKRNFDAKQRKKDSKSGVAMPDGSFPIADAEDLENAIRLAGKAKNPAAARAHIKRRAAALGLSSKIPETWKDGAKKADVAESITMTQKAASAGKQEAAAPLSPTQITDVMGQGEGSSEATAKEEPVNGEHVDATLPGNSAAESEEVKNPEEAGQATPDGINAKDTPVVEHVAGDKPSTGGAAPRAKPTRNATQNTAEKAEGGDKDGDKKKKKKSGTADEHEPPEERNATQDTADKDKKTDKKAADDPIAAAREAADVAMKAATAVMQKLAKHAAGGASVVLVPGMELRKDLSTTGRLGYLLCELSYILCSSKFEEEREGDNSQVPAKLRVALESLGAAYRAMSDEELQELLDAADKTMDGQIMLAVHGGDLAKALSGIVDEDTLSKLAGDAQDEDLAKANDRIADLETANGDLLKTMGGLTDTLGKLSAQVATLSDQPLPAKTIRNTDLPPTVAALSKAEDTAGQSAAAAQAPEGQGAMTAEDVRKALDSMDPEDRAAALMKAALHPSNAHVITR